MLKLLVLVHVLSAVIGIGPTYFGLLLLRPGLRGDALRHNLELADRLTFFPKIGGTLAVLTGIALLLVGSYGPVTQLWLVGSLVLYALVQIVVIAFAFPRERRLLALTRGEGGDVLPTSVNVSPDGTLSVSATSATEVLLKQVSALHMLAATLGTLLLVLMILKPS
ncbi:DUF2269 family protein [Deinococcus pimensis]|uniref:DUF2269 family protein n=1 Tax=Deinococcus pimensis TaxID=309888 RepID=UPI00048400DF|nr:DUF2269 family protein [Deinococcus pimensis]